ncbi:MAG: helix-turn-helix transcriptional regulator [Synergistaceae bacterium]|nr:helix-turn-helix transcriptional regulator [Synergistaceae bacterium]MBQ4419316.1 helix-turn-helix transcriptional regulator [Synergistaceae bacterium]MBQ6740719.1 helix-turn-helix transcriptional regulator [Synergistaceae bacterium]MBQ7570292.1 helix-turn-helix transcriptional regulator [Synergistaceae bacterium]MBQ9581290.1 helix-turn-helix transcriptional regulator [Synergistaceae bacterium]
MMKLNEKIKKCRLEAGLTQIELANAIGVHPNTFRKWESGDRVPKVTNLADISKVTGASMEWLLDFKSSDNKHKEDRMAQYADAVKSIAVIAMPVMFTKALVAAAGKDVFVKAVTAAAKKYAEDVLK